MKRKTSFRKAWIYLISAYFISLQGLSNERGELNIPWTDSRSLSPHTCPTHVLPYVAAALSSHHLPRIKILESSGFLSFSRASYKIHQPIRLVWPSHLDYFITSRQFTLSLGRPWETKGTLLKTWFREWSTSSEKCTMFPILSREWSKIFTETYQAYVV